MGNIQVLNSLTKENKAKEFNVWSNKVVWIYYKVQGPQGIATTLKLKLRDQQVRK